MRWRSFLSFFLLIALTVACGGCAGLLRFVGLGGAARAGAAMASGESIAARLALTRPLAFRGRVVAMDGSAAARIATGQRLAAMPEEVAMMRAMRIDPTSQAGQTFLRSLTATDSHMSTMVLYEGRLTGIKPGQQVYTSITSGSEMRAGLVRRTAPNTAVFNDGARDLIRSERRGPEVLHYSLRSGRPELVGRTIRSSNHLSFDTWDPGSNRYLTTGYAKRISSAAWEFYSVDGSHTGTLVVQPPGLTTASALPQSSIAIPLGIGAAAVIAVSGRFHPSESKLDVGCSYLSSSEPHALECDRAMLALVAREAQRIGYTVVMSDAAGYVPQLRVTGKDPNFPVEFEPRTRTNQRDPNFPVELK